MNASRKFLITLSLFTFAAITSIALLGANAESKVTLPVLGQISNFKLYDARANEFSLKELKGKVFVTDFIFTTCSGICPIMTRNLKGIHDDFKTNANIHFVSITVNPEVDSPQVLSDYAKKYEIDSGRWHFLTGSRESISDLAVKGFKIGSVTDLVFHSAYLVLADKKAQIRGYYEGTNPEEVKKLKADIQRLLKEKS